MVVGHDRIERFHAAFRGEVIRPVLCRLFHAGAPNACVPERNNRRPSSAGLRRACEAVGHGVDQRPVAQACKIRTFYGHAVFFDRFNDWNAVEQRAGFLGGEDRAFCPSSLRISVRTRRGSD
jgi:hypothetical protein